VVVLGAGIQGVCASLALEQRGWTVTLLDRWPTPMQGASVRGEGKLHLGYVYGNDPGRATATLMVDGALQFSRVVDRLVPTAIDWTQLRSRPFRYAVLDDSMVPVDELVEHYAWVDEVVSAALADGLRYAGLAEVPRAHALVSPEDHGFEQVQAAFATGEVAIDPMVLRAHLVGALHAGAVDFVGGTVVQGVERTAKGFVVSAETPDGGAGSHPADVVVNCLWDGRLAVDRTLGIEPPRPWIHRLKYGVHGTVPRSAPKPPSTTLVLGPFGDVVQHAGGRVYASWYPECMAATSTELEVPTSWASATSAPGWQGRHHEIACATVEALGVHVPALRALQVDLVAAGVIVAWGETDIDQQDSHLHHRHQIGVHDHGDGHLSVDTGKLATAPLFAEQVADRLGRPC
jgi:glycine/D-amino acid oxidase-like deaminating enzyme